MGVHFEGSGVETLTYKMWDHFGDYSEKHCLCTLGQKIDKVVRLKCGCFT